MRVYSQATVSSKSFLLNYCLFSGLTDGRCVVEVVDEVEFGL